MASDTEIANNALVFIGGTRITSLSDGTKNANAANLIYSETRADMLRSNDWNFATRRIELARSGTTPAFGFDYGYVLPSDWIRTVSVHDNDGGVGTIEFKEEYLSAQNVILADAERVFVRYVSLITDPNRMPADFRTAFAYELASRLAIPIANSNTVKELMEDKAKKRLIRAKSSDAQGSTPERRPVGSWVTSRGGRQ